MSELDDPEDELLALDELFELDFPEAAEARAASPDLLGSSFTPDELDLLPPENFKEIKIK